jgi:3-dehydroquinate synthase
MSASDPIAVALEGRAYDVHVGAGLIARAGALIKLLIGKGRAFVVTDANVALLHLTPLLQSLTEAGIPTQAIIIKAGEAQKSFAGFEQVTRALIQAGAERKDFVIALGGGVIGDLAGFAAGVLKRGMDFVQIPTTLLAQVDSSVGGKTAIDTPEGKNLVGLFHQPRLVLADLDVLKTLPARELRAGYAEIVKYGLINDAGFYDWCETNAARILACDADALNFAVRASVNAKALVVAEDEREGGVRALLNLGHTFAHALETKAGYDGALLHGEAVGTGMSLAFGLSAKMGLCSGQDAARVRQHLAQAGFETNLANLPGAPFDADELIALMAHDKKAEGGKLTLILAKGIGRAFVQKDAPLDHLRGFLQEEVQRSS